MTILSKRTPSKYPIVNGVMTYPDGREVCQESAVGKREYSDRTDTMCERQNNRCAICGQYLHRPSFDHECSRGGGKRDDRITNPDGTWKNAAVHFGCNGLKGSVRYAWVDVFYVPVSAGERTEEL